MVDFSGEKVPSLALNVLHVLRQVKILKAVRYSWWPAEESASECDIQDAEVFSFTEGPLLLYLESGEIVGIASDDSINSIVLWLERDINKNIHNEDVENDTELFAVACDDAKYNGGSWNRIAGNKIERIKLIKRKPQNAKYEVLPNETGLQLIMENKDEYILGHQLSGKTCDFSVSDKNYLNSDILDELTYIEV